MKLANSLSIKRFKHSNTLLFCIALGLILLHLTLLLNHSVNPVEQGSGQSFHALSILSWISVASLTWGKRHQLKLQSGVWATAIGLFFITLVLLRSLTLPSPNFLHLSPIISAIGVGLLASGFKGLKQYWRELVILFFLGVPTPLLWHILDISQLTAQFAHIILIYCGFDSHVQGVNVLLPTGGVAVNQGCSGFFSIMQMLCIASLFLMLNPLKGWFANTLTISLAVGLAFFVNAGRIALMAILDAFQYKASFDYWHVGGGSLIFSFVSVALFGFFCNFMQQHDRVG